jgi:predicted transcriptional regulator
MLANEEEFVLGEDVTKLAAGKARKGTVVVSVRLSGDEFRELATLSQLQGRTPSQVARDALREYVLGQHQSQATITVSLSGGATIVTGASNSYGQAVSTETPRLVPA